MLGKVKLFLLTLVAVVGLAVPALAATSPVATTITEFSLTNLNKEAMTRVNANSDFYIKIKWKITQEDADVHNGDYLELELPTQLKFPSTEGTSFPIYAPDGAEMGTANVTAGNPGRVRITFNDWVENKSDIRGTLWLAAHMNAGTPVGNQTLKVIDVNTQFSSDLNITTYTNGELNNESIAKWAVVKDGELNWKVRVNNVGATLHNVKLHDTIEGNATYIPGSFKIYQVIMDNKGNILDDPGWNNITDTTTKPVIAEDGHSFAWDLSMLPHDGKHQYFVEYKTTYENRVKNSIELTSDEEIAKHEWTYIAANSGGRGNGTENPSDPATPETPGNTDNGNTENPGGNHNPNPDNPVTPVNPDEPVNPQPQPTPEPEPQPTPEPTPEPENPPTPSNPDTPVVPDNPQPENPVNPQPEHPTTPVNPEPNKPETPVTPTTPETPSEPSEKPQKPSEDSPKQSEQKKSTHTKKVAILPNTGDNATSIAMLGGMILSGLTIIATARKMRR